MEYKYPVAAHVDTFRAPQADCDQHSLVPLRSKIQRPVGLLALTKAAVFLDLFGAIGDSAPDRWGSGVDAADGAAAGGA